MAINLVAVRTIDRRLGPLLRPLSAQDEELLRTLPYERAVAVSITWPAPEKAARWYRALLRKLVAGGVFENAEEAHFDVMIRTRRVNSMVVRETAAGDETKFWPESTTGWDGPQWREFLRDAVAVVIRDLVPQMPIGRLRAEVEREIGIRLKDALEEDPR